MEKRFMTSIALFEFKIRGVDLDAGYDTVHATLAETVAFPGSLGVEVWVHDDDPAHFAVVEYWRSIEDDKAYRTWRSGDGVPKEFIKTLASRPELTYFRRAEKLDDLRRTASE